MLSGKCLDDNAYQRGDKEKKNKTRNSRSTVDLMFNSGKWLV